MDFKIGDLVTRISHNHDMVFVITDEDDEQFYLKGVNIRLCADSPKEDLVLYTNVEDKDESDFLERIKPEFKMDRNDYFYLPGKILHIDADDDYLNRCREYYNDAKIWSIGIKEEEKNIPNVIYNLLEEYRPSIVVITGHDAYYKRKHDEKNINNYKNSTYFVDAVKEARRYEKSHEKLVIIAGACQSDYEELIKAGANFASSPKRINIHALDPAVIATSMSLSDVNQDIDLKSILEKTKYGSKGMGGIKTKGTMYIGYPR
ncbi:MAG: sporulation peptidase YabG [Bacilli bacterium]|nr:sporulation peptidase YabG [Bacilli bacterium]